MFPITFLLCREVEETRERATNLTSINGKKTKLTKSYRRQGIKESHNYPPCKGHAI